MDESIAILRNILSELREMNSEMGGINGDLKDLTGGKQHSLREIADELSKIEDKIKEL